MTRLLWPMALWTWLFFGFKLLGGAAVNSPVTITDFPLVPLPPYEHLWFLWALFLCQTLLILLYAPLPRSIPQNYLRVGAGAVGLILALFLPNLSVPSLIWGPMVAHMPYFLIGIAVGSSQMKALHPAICVLAAGVFAERMYFVISCGFQTTTTLVSCLLVIFGWIARQGVDTGADSRVLGVLRYLGKTSMAIYLTHTVFSAALRIAMLKLGLDSLPLVLIATTLIGLMLPLVILTVTRRLRLTKLLGF